MEFIGATQWIPPMRFAARIAPIRAREHSARRFGIAGYVDFLNATPLRLSRGLGRDGNSAETAGRGDLNQCQQYVPTSLNMLELKACDRSALSALYGARTTAKPARIPARPTCSAPARRSPGRRRPQCERCVNTSSTRTTRLPASAAFRRRNTEGAFTLLARSGLREARLVGVALTRRSGPGDNRRRSTWQ